MCAVPYCGPVLDQGSAGHEQVPHFQEGGAGGREGAQFDHGTEAGKQAGIDGVCLGVGSNRLCEATGLAGIDLGQGEAGRKEAALEGAVIRPGRLIDDARDGKSGEPFDQGCEAFAIVGEAAVCAGGMKVDVEGFFRDVDAQRL